MIYSLLLFLTVSGEDLKPSQYTVCSLDSKSREYQYRRLESVSYSLIIVSSLVQVDGLSNPTPHTPRLLSDSILGKEQ